MTNMIGCYNIIEQDHKILLVKEKTKSGFHWALPAGKLEVGETVIECAKREAFEESGLKVRPVSLIGIYQTPLLRGNNVINFAFHSLVTNDSWEENLLNDAEFIKYSDFDNNTIQLRDFIVATIIQDYRNGKQHPLEVVNQLRG
jgi:ADP-ribose pyrophosphatase YjhB (NUDIX family)